MLNKQYQFVNNMYIALINAYIHMPYNQTLQYVTSATLYTGTASHDKRTVNRLIATMTS